MAKQEGTTCIYKEVHPPSVVTHGASGYITHTAAEDATPNLVISRGTQLELYHIRASPSGSKKDKTCRLECICRMPLYGVVESLAVLKGRLSSQLDAIFITFRDAKLSVLEWECGSHQLRISSLHSFEGEAAMRRGKVVFPMGPRVLTDPQGRFAAVLVYDNQLAVLPALEADFFARQAALQLPAAGPASRSTFSSTASRAMVAAGSTSSMDTAGQLGAEPDQQFGSATAVGNSYVLNLAEVGGQGSTGSGAINLWAGGVYGKQGREGGQGRGMGVGGIQEVRDAVLLHGYLEPVLLVLHQPEPTWAARYRERKDSCCVSAVSLSIRRKKQSVVLWVGAGLPADAMKLVAVPGKPQALLLTPCAIILCQQGNQYGVAVSKYAVAGQPQPRVDIDSLRENPQSAHSTASKAAAQFVHNVAPEVLPAMYKGMPRAANIEADLRGAQAAWFGNTCCLITCVSGLQLAVQLRSDGPTSQRLQVSLATLSPAPPPSSCVVDLGQGRIFIGSTCGDSLLYQQHHKPLHARSSAQDRRAAKRARHVKSEAGEVDGALDEGSGIECTTEAGSDDDEDEDESKPSQPAGLALQFKAVDMLMGGGPIRDMLHVDTSAVVAAKEHNSGGPRGGPTIFAAVGSERSSGVLMLRPSLVPEIVTDVPLSGITGMWAIHYRSDEQAPPAELEAVPEGALLGPAALAKKASKDDPYHAYLLLTHGQSKTMVLETGEELQEITESSTFITAHATLAAGNLFNLAGICQVLPTAVCLFDGPELMQELSIEDLLGGSSIGAQPNATIVAAQICDPYVLLHFSHGQLVVLQGDELSFALNPCLKVHEALQELAMPGMVQGTPASPVRAPLASAACLYQDETRWLTKQLKLHEAAISGQLNGGTGAVVVKPELAADAGTGVQEASIETKAAPMEVGTTAAVDGTPAASATTFLAVVLLDGRFLMYQLPDMLLVFSGAQLGVGSELLLQHSMQQANNRREGQLPIAPAGPPAAAPTRIMEICIHSFKELTAGGYPECEQPVLVALTATGTLLVYQAFDRGGKVMQQVTAQQQAAHATQVHVKPEGGMAPNSTTSLNTPHDSPPAFTSHAALQQCLRVAWKRVALDWISHQDGAAAGASNTKTGQRLVRFDGVAYLTPDDQTNGPPQSGVFVAGARPLWLVAARGSVVPHPMLIEGAVMAMTPFHNINCSHGFIISCASSIKVGHLPVRERLDTHWSSRKVKLPGGGVVQRIAHMRDTNMLAVAASRPLPARTHLPEEPGSDVYAAAAYAGVAAAAEAAGKEDAYEVRLLQLPQLTPAPGLRPLQTQPGEALTSLRQVTLKESASEAQHTLLALGCALMLGEDYPCLGRVSLHRVEKVQRGGPTAEPTWRSTLLASRDTAGPVTHVQDYRGMLLLGVGRTVELYTLKPMTDAMRAAAATAPAVTDHSNTSIQFALVKTAFFEAPVMLTSIAVVKDFLLLGDVLKGCTFLRYVEDKKVFEQLSRTFDEYDVACANYVINTNKLLLVAADAAGTLRQFEYQKGHPAGWGGLRLLQGGALHIGHLTTRMQASKLPMPDNGNRHGLLMSSADGSWAWLAPLWDAAAAARLLTLQQHMVHALQHPAGLNPRAFRRRHLRTPASLGGGQPWGPQQAPDSNKPAQGTAASIHAATASCILDGDLLWRVAQLPRPQQQVLATLAGAVTAEQVLRDLTAWAIATTL